MPDTIEYLPYCRIVSCDHGESSAVRARLSRIRQSAGGQHSWQKVPVLVVQLISSSMQSIPSTSPMQSSNMSCIPSTSSSQAACLAFPALLPFASRILICVITYLQQLTEPRFKRELSASKDMQQKYAKLGTNKEKEAFRLQWLSQRLSGKATTTATESQQKKEKLKSTRTWMTAKQLRSHYKSKATAQKHIAFCKANASSHLKRNKVIGENTFLLVELVGSSESNRAWDLQKSWEDCLGNDKK